jgi:hypothetical protein
MIERRHPTGRGGTNASHRGQARTERPGSQPCDGLGIVNQRTAAAPDFTSLGSRTLCRFQFGDGLFTVCPATLCSASFPVSAGDREARGDGDPQQARKLQPVPFLLFYVVKPNAAARGIRLRSDRDVRSLPTAPARSASPVGTIPLGSGAAQDVL